MNCPFKKNIYSGIIIIFLLGCNIPGDPENSWSEAQAESLKVGVAENPPYIIEENDSIFGSEIELIGDFAAEHNLKIQLIKGSESELIKKLEKYELHVMLAGIEKKSQWTKKAGSTLAYDGKHIILVPKGENRLLQKIEHFILEQK